MTVNIIIVHSFELLWERALYESVWYCYYLLLWALCCRPDGVLGEEAVWNPAGQGIARGGRHCQHRAWLGYTRRHRVCTHGQFVALWRATYRIRNTSSSFSPKKKNKKFLVLCPLQEICVAVSGQGIVATRTARPIPINVCSISVGPNNGMAASVWDF